MKERAVALVTGAAAGIGRAIADTLLDAGFAVHVCDADPQAVEQFRAQHPAASASVADIAVAEQVETLFALLRERHGRLDVLVNNAGIAGPTARIEDIEPADWERTVAVDLNGQFYCTRLAVPLLKAAGGGSIVNIASNAAFFGFPLRAPYSACKWALIGLTRTLAMELGPFAIRVNAICPGSVSGPRIERVIAGDAAQRGMTSEQIRELYKRQSSMRLFVRAEDVAATVAFLVSDAGAAISGQALGVDGHTESLSNWMDE